MRAWHVQGSQCIQPGSSSRRNIQPVSMVSDAAQTHSLTQQMKRLQLCKCPSAAPDLQKLQAASATNFKSRLCFVKVQECAAGISGPLCIAKELDLAGRLVSSLEEAAAQRAFDQPLVASNDQHQQDLICAIAAFFSSFRDYSSGLQLAGSTMYCLSMQAWLHR